MIEVDWFLADLKGLESVRHDVDENLLPPFSALTTDEERERKAEFRNPGTHMLLLILGVLNHCQNTEGKTQLLASVIQCPTGPAEPAMLGMPTLLFSRLLSLRSRSYRDRHIQIRTLMGLRCNLLRYLQVA